MAGSDEHIEPLRLLAIAQESGSLSPNEVGKEHLRRCEECLRVVTAGPRTTSMVDYALRHFEAYSATPPSKYVQRWLPKECIEIRPGAWTFDDDFNSWLPALMGKSKLRRFSPACWRPVKNRAIWRPCCVDTIPLVKMPVRSDSAASSSISRRRLSTRHIILLITDTFGSFGREHLAAEIASQLLQFIDGGFDRSPSDQTHQHAGFMLNVDFAALTLRTSVSSS